MKFMMTEWVTISGVIGFAALALAQQAPAPVKKKLVAPAVSLTTDRVSALYTCQDKALFKITVLSDGKPADTGICTVKLTLDGGALISETTHDLAAGNPYTVEASLDKPGFVRCDFMGVDAFPIRARATAGFDVERIAPGSPEPADFDAYWADLLKRQAAITNAVTCEPLPDSAGKPGYRYFKVSVKTVDDGRVYAFLSVPARPGRFAALAVICGAGPGYDGPDPTFTRPDLMTLAINIHPIDPTLPKDERDRLYKEMTAERPYWLLGAPDRDRYHFRNGILGAHAAVEWLTRHAQYDGTNLLYLSASQGGGFGLMLGGLNPRFTAIAVCVPALCDHGGIAAGRGSGWPHLVKTLAGDDAGLRRRCLEMAGYFDAAHFARRVRCPVIFTVGFNDATCCPSSVYAAYNAITTPKWILTGPLEDHPVPWEHLNGIWQWIQDRLDPTGRIYRAYFKY